MSDLAERWEEVGRWVTDAVNRTESSILKVAVRAGVSDKFVSGLMAGRPGDRRHAQVAKLGREFGWRENWLNRLLAGLEPELLPAEATSDPIVERLDAIEAELARLRQIVEPAGGDVVPFQRPSRPQPPSPAAPAQPRPKAAKKAPGTKGDGRRVNRPQPSPPDTEL